MGENNAGRICHNLYKINKVKIKRIIHKIYAKYKIKNMYINNSLWKIFLKTIW
tara:strand:+ start:19 stop:177 length:159 start_codon:yes stop_codon:yes gene_type:complete